MYVYTYICINTNTQIHTHTHTHTHKNSPTRPLWAVLRLLQAWVLYQKPGSLRVLHRILAVPRIALFWIEISDVIPGICWSHAPSLGVTAPSAPLIMSTTDARDTTDFFVSLDSGFRSIHRSRLSSGCPGFLTPDPDLVDLGDF